MKKDDIEFLKDLQHELLTQPNDGNANPLYWSIVEEKKVYTPDGHWFYTEYILNDQTFTFEELIEYINDYVKDLSNNVQVEWDCVYKADPEDVENFIRYTLKEDRLERLEYNYDTSHLVKDTGCFITKRAAQHYVDTNSHNHHNPRTYAMTAYRNFEYERLLKILKELNFDDIKVD